MAAGRPMIQKSGVNSEQLNTGDTLLLGQSVTAGALTTIGAGTWTAAMMVSGLITRSGPVADYTDTTDTAANILAALAGNAGAGADVQPGTTFNLTFINTVALEMTLAAGTGVALDTTNGTGNLNSDDATSPVRDYIVTILNASPPRTIQALTTNGNKVITFILPAGRSALTMGPNGGGDITPGMIVSGTGITAGTKVLGITLGVGGLVGVVTDTNSTATTTALGTPITFNPSLSICSTGSRSL